MTRGQLRKSPLSWCACGIKGAGCTLDLWQNLIFSDAVGDISAIWSLLRPVHSVSAGAAVPMSKQG